MRYSLAAELERDNGVNKERGGGLQRVYRERRIQRREVTKL